MSDALPPSIDPAQRHSFMGTVQFLVDKLVKQEMDDMLPAKVIAYDRTKNRATVQIMVCMVNTLNQQVSRAQIASVPVLQLGGGGFVLSFPIVAGNTGWIKATDTDMSLFLQSLSSGGEISPPNTAITHKFDSSMFIPDTMFHNVVINSEDAANVVFQTLDGTVRIALWDGEHKKVKITAPELLVVCPQTTIDASDVLVNTTTAEINASDTTTVTSPNVDVIATNVSVSANDVEVITTTAEVVASGAVSVTSSTTIDLTATTSITLTAPITYISGALAAGSTSGDTAAFSGPISTTQTVTATGDVVGAGKSLSSHVHSGVEPGGGNSGPPV